MRGQLVIYGLPPVESRRLGDPGIDLRAVHLRVL